MLLVDRVAALHRVDLFADVPGRTLAAVARALEETSLDAGETFLHQGAVEDHLYVVVEGRVRVHRDGRTMAEIGRGDTVGELAALVPEPRSASATAIEPTTLLVLAKPVLDELLADRPNLAAAVIAALVARLRGEYAAKSSAMALDA